MRDMREMGAPQDPGADCTAAPSDLPASTSLGVPAASSDVRAALAGKPRGASDSSEVARVVRTVWLAIASGGWWTLKDVRNARPSLKERDVASRLSVMTKKGLIVSRELPQEKRQRRVGAGGGPRPRYEYSVTSECRVPAGLTAGEVSRALIG
jgi:hypothetical protein